MHVPNLILTELCDRTRAKYIKCARQYLPCLRTMTRQVYGIVVQNVNTLLRDVCSTGKKTGELAAGVYTNSIIVCDTDFLRHIECVNKRTLSTITGPSARLSQYFAYVASNITREQDLIPWTCCAYFSCECLPKLRFRCLNRS